MDVILITMPWAGITYPSIQLGIVKSLLDRSQVPCAPTSLNLSFFEYLAARPESDRLSLEQYNYIGEASGLGLGEWIFASAARGHSDAARDDAYRDFVTGKNPERGVLEKAERVREVVPGFLDQCAENILAARPRVAGFTEDDVKDFLDQMVNIRLVFEESGHYLSLALPEGERLDFREQQTIAMPEEKSPATTRPFPAPVV